MPLCDGIEMVGREKKAELPRSGEGRRWKTWRLDHTEGETESVESAGFPFWEPGWVMVLPIERGLRGRGSFERTREKVRGPQVPERDWFY